MHGRLAFDPTSGARHLQDVYMEFDDFMARRRVLLGTHKPVPAQPQEAAHEHRRRSCRSPRWRTAPPRTTRCSRGIEDEELTGFPDRVLGWLRTMEDSAGYQVTRLEHWLQAATRAHRAGEDEETVVCVLLHDIGDNLAPANHSEVAAAVLRPYVSERNYWIVKHHGVFQGYYYFHHTARTRTRATVRATTRGTRPRSTSARTTTRTPSTRTTTPSR